MPSIDNVLMNNPGMDSMEMAMAIVMVSKKKREIVVQVEMKESDGEMDVIVCVLETWRIEWEEEHQ